MAAKQVESAADSAEEVAPLTVASEETVRIRIRRDSEFAAAMLDESISLFVNGESDISRLMLRDLVNATIGFEQLAAVTDRPSKSLHRMLSVKGNPTMDNLSAIIVALRKAMKVKSIEVTSTVEATAEDGAEGVAEELLQSA